MFSKWQKHLLGSASLAAIPASSLWLQPKEEHRILTENRENDPKLIQERDGKVFLGASDLEIRVQE